MNLINIIGDRNLKEKSSDFKGWFLRQAVRAVLFNAEGKIALMHIGSLNTYKLPGGGVENDEDLETAFIREILEETGCEAIKTADLGITIETREERKLAQISYAYIATAKVVTSPNLVDYEIEQGFELEWVDNLDKAIELVAANKTDDYSNQFISTRDLSILKTAKKYLNNKN